MPAGRQLRPERGATKALGAFFEVLEGYSIDDLIKTRPSVRSLLGIDLDAPRALAG